uniref:Short coiled-coil protein A-like n=2 Tax=Sinocyclocheilus anshuiensis TaxID=1608454 RepID=A0A671KT08_9TELE
MEGDVDEDDGTFTNISLADDSADGEPTVLSFRPEDQYTTMNCEIDGKYHPQFGIICYIMLLKCVFLQFKLLWSNFRCVCVFSGDMENQVEQEEKMRLINQVLELQHTLEDLSARVDAVKEENLKLKSENQVLGQYIENLMSASSVFQTTDTKSKRK